MNQMHQLVHLMCLHQLRAGPGATLGLQAPSIVLITTSSFTRHDVSIWTIIFINILFVIIFLYEEVKAEKTQEDK
jgi:hypothetical protein